MNSRQYKIFYRDGYSSSNKEISVIATEVVTDDMGRLSFKNNGVVIAVFKWEFIAGYYVSGEQAG